MELRAFVLLGLAACTPARPPAPPPNVTAIAAKADVTVVTFFSAHCPCQAAHDERLRALAATYAPKGVQFVSIDAEASATPEKDEKERLERKYPFPIWTDAKGQSADALGAVYATYTVVLDRQGAVRYAGGIDSDRTHLTDDAETYVKNALEDSLHGRPVRVAQGKVLGCALSR